MRVIDLPIVDLRVKPEELLPIDYSHNDNRETQLLYGERVEILDRQPGWLKIAALEQPVYNEAEGWHPCPGWVKESEVRERDILTPPSRVIISSPQFSFGTLTDHPEGRVIPSNPCRATLVADAHLFLGSPYLWGGRSSHSSNTISGVDCSGLINLLYRAQGIAIPRNSYHQCLAGQPISTLLPGDPLYLAKETRVNHVILKVSPNQFIEAPETGKNVRLLTWGEDIWQEEGKIHFFDRPHFYTPFPRTFLNMATVD